MLPWARHLELACSLISYTVYDEKQLDLNQIEMNK